MPFVSPALSKLQVKYLIDRGIPDKVILRLNTLSETLVNKMSVAMSTSINYRVALLSGNESQQKEIFAALMLINLAIQTPRSVAMCQALTLCKFDKEDSASPSDAKIWAVLGLSLVQAGFAAQKVKEFLMGTLSAPGGFLILGAESLQSLSDIYGKGFSDYLKSISFGVVIDPEEAVYINL